MYLFWFKTFRHKIAKSRIQTVFTEVCKKMDKFDHIKMSCKVQKFVKILEQILWCQKELNHYDNVYILRINYTASKLFRQHKQLLWKKKTEKNKTYKPRWINLNVVRLAFQVEIKLFPVIMTQCLTWLFAGLPWSSSRTTLISHPKTRVARRFHTKALLRLLRTGAPLNLLHATFSCRFSWVNHVKQTAECILDRLPDSSDLPTIENRV